MCQQELLELAGWSFKIFEDLREAIIYAFPLTLMSEQPIFFSVIQVFSESPGNSAQLRVLLVFYASTIVSALGAAEKITDTMVSLLLPYVQKVGEAVSLLCDEVYCVLQT